MVGYNCGKKCTSCPHEPEGDQCRLERARGTSESLSAFVSLLGDGYFNGIGEHNFVRIIFNIASDLEGALAKQTPGDDYE